MDKPSGPHRIDPQRRQRVARICARLRRAMQDDPFLLRLPPEKDLARLMQVAVREVRYALAALAEEGLLRTSGRHGYRVVKRPAIQSEVVHTVNFAGPLSIRTSFCPSVHLGADTRCRELGLKFQVRYPALRQWSEHLAAAVADESAHGVGWLIQGMPSEESATTWLDEGRRFVLVDFLHPQIALPAAMLNLASAAGLAVEHLQSLGHRGAGIIHGMAAPVFSSLAREFSEHGFTSRTGWHVQLPLSGPEEAPTLLAPWLRRWRGSPDRPTAVIVHDLVTALQLLDACRAIGVAVPEELSVVAFGSRYGRGELPLTTASTGKAEDLGRLAVDTLLLPDVMQARPIANTLATLEKPGLTTGKPHSPRR